MAEDKNISGSTQLSHIIDHPRVIALSDAVFAFALTLLVLEIRVPGGLDRSGLLNALLGMGPRLIVYLISFIVIGLSWDGHQRIMSKILWSDGTLVWLNLAILLFVTLLPATSALLGLYPTEPLAVACLAANGFLLNLSEWLLWRHACGNYHLVSPDLPQDIIQMVNQIALTSTIVYGLSILIAFISIPLAGVAWVSVLTVSYMLPLRLRRRGITKK